MPLNSKKGVHIVLILLKKYIFMFGFVVLGIKFIIGKKNPQGWDFFASLKKPNLSMNDIYFKDVTVFGKEIYRHCYQCRKDIM